MPHQLTVTSKTGPDKTNTALVLQNLTRLDFDLIDKILQAYVDPPTTNVKEYDISAATVITITITAGNYAVVVS